MHVCTIKLCTAHYRKTHINSNEANNYTSVIKSSQRGAGFSRGREGPMQHRAQPRKGSGEE